MRWLCVTDAVWSLRTHHLERPRRTQEYWDNRIQLKHRLRILETRRESLSDFSFPLSLFPAHRPSNTGSKAYPVLSSDSQHFTHLNGQIWNVVGTKLSAPFSMLGGTLDLGKMFGIAGDNWVTLQTKLQEQQPKADLVSAAAWAQLRGSRIETGTTVLLHTQEPEILQAERSYFCS